MNFYPTHTAFDRLVNQAAELADQPRPALGVISPGIELYYYIKDFKVCSPIVLVYPDGRECHIDNSGTNPTVTHVIYPDGRTEGFESYPDHSFVTCAFKGRKVTYCCLNGKREGLCTTAFQDGTIIVHTYKEGKYEGPCHVTIPGLKKMSFTYVADKIEGPLHVNYEKGRSATYTFNGDTLDGPAIVKTSAGQIHSFTFKKGSLNGAASTYHPDETFTMMTYENNCLEGLVITTFKDGTQEVNHYIKGILQIC